MREKLGLLGCLLRWGCCCCAPPTRPGPLPGGTGLCAGSVIPALFPFLAVSGLLTALDAGAAPGRGRMLLARVLGCGPAGAGAFLLGLWQLSCGARTVAQLYREKRISRPEACRLLLFCNNCGPRLFWAWRAWAASAVSGPGDCCGPSTCWQPWASPCAAPPSAAAGPGCRRGAAPGLCRRLCPIRPGCRRGHGADLRLCGVFPAALRLTARLTGCPTRCCPGRWS